MKMSEFINLCSNSTTLITVKSQSRGILFANVSPNFISCNMSDTEILGIASYIWIDKDMTTARPGVRITIH